MAKLGRKTDEPIPASLLSGESASGDVGSAADYGLKGEKREVFNLLTQTFTVDRSGAFLLLQIVDAVVLLRQLDGPIAAWAEAEDYVKQANKLLDRALDQGDEMALKVAEIKRKSGLNMIQLGKEAARERRELQMRVEKLIDQLGVQDQVGEDKELLQLLHLKNQGTHRETKKDVR